MYFVPSRVWFNFITIQNDIIAGRDCTAVVHPVQFALLLVIYKVGQLIDSKHTKVKQLRCYERLIMSILLLERATIFLCVFSFVHLSRFGTLNSSVKIRYSLKLYYNPVPSDTPRLFFKPFTHDNNRMITLC